MKLIIPTLMLLILLNFILSGLTIAKTDEHDHEQQNEQQMTGLGEKALEKGGGHDEGHAHEAKEGGHQDGHGYEESKTGSHVNLDGHSKDEHGDDEHEQGGHEEGVIALTADKKQLANIVVLTLEQKTLQQEITLPGEVKANRYATSILSPRISAQIIKRHARLGQSVKQGQTLVTLSSVEMAEAQGELIVANKEWQRVKKLGRKVVSEKRYIQAQIAQQQARAKVLAYGMTAKQVEHLLDEGDVAGATGQLDLLAPQNGTVIKDDFINGEIVEPGRVLYEITDDTNLWVEARARPEDASIITKQAKAKIKFQNIWFDGKVAQVQHVVDEETRTLPVRLEVSDRQHRLHPGQFVEVRLQLTTDATVMAIPKAAALRNPNGEWIVFVEEKPDRYESVDIKPIRTSGDQLIVEGLSSGMRVVTQGAFFLQSEMAKSGFDVHNH